MKTTFLKTGLVLFLFFIFIQNSIKAQDNPIADFSFIVSCDGLTATFVDLSTDPNAHTIDSWNWDFDDGLISTEQNPVHVYASNSNYTVGLIVGNDVGGADTIYKVVSAMEFQAIINFSNNVSCFGGSDGQISANTIGGNPAFNYNWDNLFYTQVVSGLSAGSYDVTITDSQGCSATTTGTILAPPPMIVSFETSPCITWDSLGWISANVSGGSAPYSYFWSNGVSSNTIWSVDAGSYFITVVDANGCTAAGSALLNNYCDYTLAGYVFVDENENGVFDVGEVPVNNTLVYSAPGPFYAYTNSEGWYCLPLEMGNYNIFPVNSSLYNIVYPVSGFQSVYIESTTDTLENVNFGLKADTLCSFLNVTLGTGTIRPCFDRSLTINYSNLGTVSENDVYIEVQLDNNISPVSSLPVWDSVVGNTVYYGIGTMNAFDYGVIYMQYYTDCDLGIVGQTRCFAVNIFPQNTCLPENEDWDHSSVMVSGECTGDSLASFVITNTGDPVDGDMDIPSTYRVYENENMVFSNSFQLDGGESLIITWPANGMAIRLEADQHIAHPGSSHPQETIENCGDLDGSSFGLITAFPFDDSDPFIDVLCRQIVNSCDPNDKWVYPSGLTENHYVDNFSSLSYLINFQNTGSDTAFTVVVRDTLPELLDVTTVVPGAASHPYTFNIYGEGILEWTFENINLVDSITNEPESHGYLSFDVEQVEIPINQYGVVISNKADIYFDFNEPVITEPAWVTVWELPLLLSLVPEQQNPVYGIKVFPNPVQSSATIEVNGLAEGQILQLKLFSITGKEVFYGESSSGNAINIHRSNLHSGMYIYHVYSGKEFIGNGKLIVE